MSEQVLVGGGGGGGPGGWGATLTWNPDAIIRRTALDHAMKLYGNCPPSELIGFAKQFEAYLKGEEAARPLHDASNFPGPWSGDKAKQP